jgi:transcriptional regulator with XRE-family HTH domain
MSAREAFGPNLRRLRVQRGLTLEQIADRTKVSVALWGGLEQNDLSRWPSGLFARSYVREYAEIVGADPDATVDEFCRWFPQGDRRAERIIRGQAAIVGHSLDWDEQVPPEADRRAGNLQPESDSKKPRPFAALLRRVLSRA